MRRFSRAAAAGRQYRAWALALAGGLLVGPIALHMQSAMAAPTVQITAPADNAQISGNAVHIKASVAFGSDRLSSWKVEVALNPPNTQNPVWNVVPGAACSNPDATGSSVAIDCVWDTTKSLPDNSASTNNFYQVRVTAHDAGPFNPSADYLSEIKTVVANGTATPTGLTLSLDSAAQRLTVTWNPNTEPDLLRYILNETINGKQTGWTLTPSQAHCTASSCSWSRQLTTGGTYNYSVVAVRNAPGTPSGTVQSQASTSRSATFADPNPTTTTTTRPANNGTSTDPTATPPKNGNSNPLGRGSDNSAVQGFRVVQIAGGGPGTVSSSGSALGRFVTGGFAADSVGEGSEPDSGFTEKLPYKAVQNNDQQPESIGTALANIPTRLITDETARKRAMTIIAIGLVAFVFAMQVRFITKRAAS